MTGYKVVTKNPLETQKLAQLLAWEILKIKPRKKAIIIGLIGELGAGKTTFIQGFAKALRIKEKVLSPSFLILKQFKIPKKNRFLYHLDCYRLKNIKELRDLDFKEIISAPENIVIIEWADKIKRALPKETLWLRLKILAKTTRYFYIYQK